MSIVLEVTKKSVLYGVPMHGPKKMFFVREDASIHLLGVIHLILRHSHVTSSDLERDGKIMKNKHQC